MIGKKNRNNRNILLGAPNKLLTLDPQAVSENFMYQQNMYQQQPQQQEIIPESFEMTDEVIVPEKLVSKDIEEFVPSENGGKVKKFVVNDMSFSEMLKLIVVFFISIVFLFLFTETFKIFLQTQIPSNDSNILKKLTIVTVIVFLVLYICTSVFDLKFVWELLRK